MCGHVQLRSLSETAARKISPLFGDNCEQLNSNRSKSAIIMAVGHLLFQDPIGGNLIATLEELELILPISATLKGSELEVFLTTDVYLEWHELAALGEFLCRMLHKPFG